MKIHVRIQDKTFEVKIGDIQVRPIQVEVDGEVFEVWPEETLAPSDTSLTVSSTPQITHPVPPVESNGPTVKSSEKTN